MDGDSQKSGLEILKSIVEKINVRGFLFVFGLVIVLAIFGGFVLPDYRPLIILAAGIALILYAAQVIVSAVIRLRRPNHDSSHLPIVETVPTVVVPPTPGELAKRSSALSESEQLTMYLDFTRKTNNALRLAGLSAEASDPQKTSAEARNPTLLSDVFISLRINRFHDDDESKQKMPREMESLGRERKQLTAIEALSEPKMSRSVMLGQPGSGKTSIARYVAYRLAESFLMSERLKETLPEWKASAMLPVVLSLAQLADALPANAKRDQLDDLLVEFVRGRVEFNAEMRGFAQRLWREARERGVFFLFDGLDEVNPDKRAVVKNAIEVFTAARGQCRALVTCRAFSYGDPKWKLDGWEAYQLEPLSADEQKTFIQKWYDKLIENDLPSRALYEKKATRLDEAIFSGDARQLSDISNNPLLLTLIAIVHTHEDELPRSRATIYEKCVALLLMRWQQRRQPSAPLRTVIEEMTLAVPDLPTPANQLMRGLREMAFNARQGATKQGESTVIDRYALRNALQRYLPTKAIDVFEDYCQNANGLLLGIGSRHLSHRPADEDPVPCFAFPHPSFEEFLTSQHIATLQHPQKELAMRNAASDRWFFVGVFLGERYAVVDQNAWQMLELFDELLNDQTAWRSVWLAGVLWLLFKREFPDKVQEHENYEKRIGERLKVLCAEGKLLPRERADAGRVLSEIGDTRDLEELVTIPKGKFIMGSKEKGSYLDESPQHEVTIPYDYQIGKYAVTVKLWKRFVNEAKYECDPDSLNGYDNHPAHDVSWRDSRNFCSWLTDVWRKEGKIRKDEVVRLPSEAEWERAARGTQGFEWSWGNEFKDDHANTSESGIGRATAVGSFPKGKSPEGCLDMIGNVWEWILSLTEKYPYKADGSREQIKDEKDDRARVLRGGSFGYNQRSARGAYRDSYHPRSRSDNVGFRVVVSSIS